MTDEKGLVRISLNCPYPFPVSEESPVKPEYTLPVPYNDSFPMRVFCAAVLNEMGFDPDFVYRAVAHQPRTTTPESAEKAEYEIDKRWMISDLRSVPSLEANIVFDPEEMVSRWVNSADMPDDPEEVYRTILTTARFGDDGDVTFKTTSQ